MGLFEFETKIRKMIIDMIDPIQKRLGDDRDKLVKLRTDLESTKRKTEDLDFAVQKTDGKLSAFEDIYKKISRLVHSLLLNTCYRTTTKRMRQSAWITSWRASATTSIYNGGKSRVFLKRISSW